MAVLLPTTNLQYGSVDATALYDGDLLVWPAAPYVPPDVNWGTDEVMYPPEQSFQGAPDLNPFPLGNAIQCNVDGRVTAIRHWLHSGAQAQRRVSLWSEAGALLAEATGTATAPGWVTTPIPPVRVYAGQRVVPAFSYYGSPPDGNFAFGTATPLPSASSHLTWVCGMYGDLGNPDIMPDNPITPNHYAADVVFNEAIAPPEPPYRGHIMATAPLSYWRLGEASGTVAVDEMGYHDGGYTGVPALGVPGLLEGDPSTAMQVAGLTGQGMNAGNVDFQLYHDFTIEAWVQTTNPGPSFRSIVVKQNDYGMFIIDGVFTVYEWGSSAYISSGVNVADGQRHHCVVQFGINYGPAESQMYLDGVPVGPAFTHTLFSQSQQLTVGYNDYPTQELTGIIDEVAIYNRRLTPAEVAMNHDVGVASPTTWRKP